MKHTLTLNAASPENIKTSSNLIGRVGSRKNWELDKKGIHSDGNIVPKDSKLVGLIHTWDSNVENSIIYLDFGHESN